MPTGTADPAIIDRVANSGIPVPPQAPLVNAQAPPGTECGPGWPLTVPSGVPR
jgi:hypothetical protein